MAHRLIVEFSPKRYTLSLLLFSVFFVVIHCVLNIIDYEHAEVPWLILQLFELDEENNLPTWFSSFLLLNCALVLWSQSQQESEGQRAYWLLLAAGFLILSIDEVSGLHESFHTAIDDNWTIYGAVLVTIVGLAYLPFLMRLERSLAAWFVLSGTIYLSGVLGVEWLSRDMDTEFLSYRFAVAAEEGLEMLGAWLFLRTNLVHMSQ